MLVCTADYQCSIFQFGNFHTLNIQTKLNKYQLCAQS
jgi:hypothetical protein